MKRTGFVMAVAMLAASVAYAGQPAATAQKKTAEKKEAKKEAGEQSEESEKQIPMSKLPAAVRATVEAESKGATVKGITSEKEKGKTVYELEMLVNGRTRDVMIDGAGKVYVVEDQLDVDKAPAAVKAALEAKGKIVTLETVRKDGKTTYEGVVVNKAGKKVEIEVDADGKPVKP
jgi:uncharacterized membrane protein YkoI